MITSLILAACTCCAAACQQNEQKLAATLPAVFEKSAAHYRALNAAATPLMKDEKGNFRVPHGVKKTGELDMRSIYWWTSGHFPGSLWYLYEATGDDFFKAEATKWTEILEPVKDYKDNHDVGFMMYCSYGNARRLLKTNRYDDILRTTANTLCMRYNDELGLLRSWGKVDDRKTFRVIPDNMMNLELLMWAAKNGADKRVGDIAVSHARVSSKHHFRADSGCYHVLDYDQVTRRVKNVDRGQGASVETAWSRGQSWAIYGYAMMYRETKIPEFLDRAMACADFAISNPNMPEDGIPYWDYGAPGEERDSSAGSIMASGLLDLAKLAPCEKAKAYRAFAVKQLLSLCSDAYFAKPGENGDWLLKHGVGHKPAGSEVDVPLDYGDYYFLEALLRFKASF